MTRVARLNEDMWTELFFDNKPALLEEIEGLIDRLEGSTPRRFARMIGKLCAIY